jgi:hypothetical protein
MDINKINDLQALKAMAYDCIARKETAERDLQIINNRIAEITEAQVKLPAGKEDKKAKKQ